MPKYRVRIKFSNTLTANVSADNEQQALSLVLKKGEGEELTEEQDTEILSVTQIEI